MLKIIGFLALALCLSQGLQSAPLCTTETSAPSELMLLDDDCSCNLPEWKVNVILKYAANEFQHPLLDLMSAYDKGELTIDEIVNSNGDVQYNVTYAPCGSCGVLSDALFN